MDLFGFDDNNERISERIREEENRILIETAIKKYKKGTTSLFIIFGIIIVILNLLIVPTFFNYRLEQRINELQLNYARERNLPENYTMIGVEVGALTIDSVLEIKCTAATSSSAGSGFIINQEGYIVTNAHVVTYQRGSFFSTVTTVYPTIRGNFYNSTQSYILNVINYDLTLDIAILRFSAIPENLSPVVFGNSDLLNMGEEVIAIGNAQGLGLALTVGVVSDPLKTFTDGTKAIQTDAAINPGNSGGPLFNVYAEMVGVTTFKIIDTNANEGMGFAIPSKLVIQFIETTKTAKSININYTLSDNY